MVTFLDLGLFQYFNVIFPILLIFSVLFALLQKIKVLGDSQVINSVVAIAISLMSLLSQTLIDLINFMAPWFVLVFIFLILLLLIYQTLGATEKDILSALKGEKTIQWAVVGVAFVILMAGLGQIIGPSLLPVTQSPAAEDTTTLAEGGVATGSVEQNMLATLYNPKVLGLIFVFLIAIFTVAFLSGS